MIQLNETENGHVLVINQESPEEFQEIVYNLMNVTLFQITGGNVKVDCQHIKEFQTDDFFKYALLSLCKMYHDFLEDTEGISIVTVMHRLNELVIDDLMEATAEMTAKRFMEQIEELANADEEEISA